MSKPLLSIDTLLTRPVIAIDNKPFELVNQEELPVLDSHALAAQGRRIQALMAADTLDEVEKAELKGLVLSVSDRLLEHVPAEVRAKLTEAHRLSVIETFSTLLLSKKTGTAAALIAALVPSLTGVISPPGSAASTAAPQATGSAKPL